MDNSTIQTLNALNQTFYQAFAAQFDDTRQQAWEGWHRILSVLKDTRFEPETPHVLDVGCGNGRFLSFLAERWGIGFDYLGIDSCSSLLACAPKTQGSEFELCDVLEAGLPAGMFSVISAFGFFHHVPSFDRRRSLLEEMADRLKPNGLLTLAFWDFAKKPRFENKTLDWPKDLDREEGDYILSWSRGGEGRRYCHHVSVEEEHRLLDGLGLEVVERFLADGKTKDLNRYLVMRKH